MEKVNTQNASKLEVKDHEEIKSNKEQEVQLRNAIMLAVDLESSFKLYSYRCISAEVFTSRVNELVNFFTHDNKDKK